MKDNTITVLAASYLAMLLVLFKFATVSGVQLSDIIFSAWF